MPIDWAQKNSQRRVEGGYLRADLWGADRGCPLRRKVYLVAESARSRPTHPFTEQNACHTVVAFQFGGRFPPVPQRLIPVPTLPIICFPDVISPTNSRKFSESPRSAPDRRHPREKIHRPHDSSAQADLSTTRRSLIRCVICPAGRAKWHSLTRPPSAPPGPVRRPPCAPL